MVRVSDLDEFLHGDTVENGAIVEIVGKAIFVSAEDSTFDRPYLQILVKLPNGKQKIWTPNKTSLRNLAKVFGDDTDLWAGKRAKITVAKQNVRGEMRDVIYAEPYLEATRKQATINLQ